MLKQRILTALVLVPLVVWGIFALPTVAIAAFFGLVVVLGSWEWTRLMGLSAAGVRLGYALLVFVCLSAGWVWRTQTAIADVVYGVALLWWLVAFVFVVRYPAGTAAWTAKPRQTVVGLLILVPTWWALVAMHGSATLGPAYVLYLLVLIWGADTGAYFGGRRWGRRKLAPAVSPGKTWEGVASAMVTVCMVALAGVYALDIEASMRLAFVGLSLVTVAFSILGDLAESMYKRHAGVKDSGTLLPGHGGVLDRIDSVTAAAPVFMLGLILIGLAPR